MTWEQRGQLSVCTCPGWGWRVPEPLASAPAWQHPVSATLRERSFPTPLLLADLIAFPQRLPGAAAAGDPSLVCSAAQMGLRPLGGEHQGWRREALSRPPWAFSSARDRCVQRRSPNRATLGPWSQGIGRALGVMGHWPALRGEARSAEGETGPGTRQMMEAQKPGIQRQDRGGVTPIPPLPGPLEPSQPPEGSGPLRLLGRERS